MLRNIIGPGEGTTGELHGGVGTFRILIDKEISGAKNFSLLFNITNPNRDSEAHSHKQEHGFYMLEGKGIMEMEKRLYRVGPGTAIFVPPGVSHKLTCRGDIPLRYLVIYSPPGPELELKREGRDAFGNKY